MLPALSPLARFDGEMPRRILMTVDAVGGVWRYALDLAAALAPRPVLLLGSGPQPSAAARAACATLGNVELRWCDLPLDWLVEDEAALRGTGALLQRIAAEWGAELLHLNLPSQAADLADGIPVVVVAHSCVPSWWQAMRGGPLPAAWGWQLARNRRGLQRADAVLVPSAAHAAALRRAYGPLERLGVVPNATAPVAELAPKRPFVLAAGRWWDEGKGGAVLDAAARDGAWPVVMAGALEGPNGQRFAPQHADARGELASGDLAASMRHAAIFAAPSRYEPFGLGVLEAAMQGAALVLSDLPVFRELWQDTALLVPADDVPAWRAALGLLSRDPDRRARLGAAARRRAEAFTPARQATGVLAAYASAARRAACFVPLHRTA